MDKLEHYWKLGEAEQRFNETQAGIRTLASGWLLASIGAIAVMLKAGGDGKWIIAPELIVVIIATLGCLGLAILWVMDQLVYHRLLNSIFLVGLRLEYADSTLPPIRSMMMESAEGEGMHQWQRLYYVVPMMAYPLVSAFLLFNSGFSGMRAAGPPLTTFDHILGAALLVVQISAVVWVFRKGGVIGFADKAPMFGDEGFTRIVRDGSYETVIGRFRGLPDDASDRNEQ